MQHLIAQYLFQHKKCSIPGLGTLSVDTKNASADFVNKQLLSPVSSISFTSQENEEDGLVNYFAAQNNKGFTESKEQLTDYAALLKQGKPLKGIGQFFVDASGNIEFRPEEINANLLQPVKAERVIHPEAQHTMLVGDKETTNTQMTEYYSEEPVKKDLWWVWAIVLGVAAIATILIYLNNCGSNAQFGIATNIVHL